MKHQSHHSTSAIVPRLLDNMRSVWQRLPMGRGRILIPADIGRIPQGVWLHAACRPLALAACNTIGQLSKASIALLRRGFEDWTLPIESSAWDEWLGDVAGFTGAMPSHWLVMPAPDEHRARFSVILLDGDLEQVAYARWTLNPANALSIRAEEELTRDPPATFRHPALLASGLIDGWTFTLSAPLSPGPHRPATLTPELRRSIVTEIQERLAPLVPEGETPVHGDFTPWNVRAIRGEVVVIDWEQFGSGPVAADELWHVVTGALATGGNPREAIAGVRTDLRHYTPAELALAATFWRRRETEDQPKEVDEDAERSVKLIRFEEQISEALQQVEKLA